MSLTLTRIADGDAHLADWPLRVQRDETGRWEISATGNCRASWWLDKHGLNDDNGLPACTFHTRADALGVLEALIAIEPPPARLDVTVTAGDRLRSDGEGGYRSRAGCRVRRNDRHGGWNVMTPGSHIWVRVPTLTDAQRMAAGSPPLTES